MSQKSYGLEPELRVLIGACLLIVLGGTLTGCMERAHLFSESELRAQELTRKGGEAEASDSLRVALKWYERATETDSTYALGQLLAANTHARLDEFEEGLPHINQTIRLRPDFARGYFEQSWYLRELGQLDASRRAVYLGIGLEPDQPLGYTLLGDTYLRDGLPGTARAYYLEAVARYENESVLRSQLLTQIDSVAAHAPDNVSIDAAQMVADLEAAWTERIAEEVSARGTPQRPRSQQSLLALLATWLTVVGGILTLFQQTEDTVTGPQRERIRAWLLRHRNDTESCPLEGHIPPHETPENETELERTADDENESDAENVDDATKREKLKRSDWSSTFVELFESVFGRSHWSWRCLFRSAVATLATIAVILVVTASAEGVPGGLRYGGGLTNLAALLVVMFVSNLVADYLSLYETRWALGRLATKPRGTVGNIGFLGLDLVLTSLIVLLSTVSVMLLLGGLGQLMTLPAILEPTPNNLQSWSTSFGEGRRLIFEGTSVEIFPALAMLGSTYFTSIWALLYVLAGAALRTTRRVFDGVAGLSRVLDIDERSLQAMGIALSIVVTALFGLGQWLL